MHPGWAAAGLAGHGVAKVDRVALLSRNSDEVAAIAWGAARLGVTLVPINFMLTGDEVGYIVGDAQPEFVDTATEAIAASGPSPGGEGGGAPPPISPRPTPPAGRRRWWPTTTRSA